MSCPKTVRSESDAEDEPFLFQPLPAVVHTCTSIQKDMLPHSGGMTEHAESEEFIEISEERSGERSYEHKELTQDGMSHILDVECGEPIVAQHLRIDFNPLEGVDDSDYLLNKCMNFWKLVEGSKTLQQLQALPEKNIEESISKSSQSEESFFLRGEFPPPRLGAIEVIEEKGKAVDDSLINKINRRYCEEGSGDYFVDVPSKSGVMTKWATSQKSARPRHPSRAQREEVANMCKELEQWDLDHPKCMEPPNHGPPHTYAVMQRNH